MQQDAPAPFRGKVALVTGATSGIGRAAALAFARGGASVVLVGRNEARGHEASQACGTKAAFVAADISRPDDMRSAVAQAVALFGRLDIAFNNAAYQEPRAPLADQPDDRFDLVFDTNVKSIFHAMKAEIAVMLSKAAASSSTTPR